MDAVAKTEKAEATPDDKWMGQLTVADWNKPFSAYKVGVDFSKPPPAYGTPAWEEWNEEQLAEIEAEEKVLHDLYRQRMAWHQSKAADGPLKEEAAEGDTTVQCFWCQAAIKRKQHVGHEKVCWLAPNPYDSD